MKCPEHILKPGTTIVTNYELESTKGFLIAEKHINARRINTNGVIAFPVPGHGGDVYFVDHADGSTGVYCWSEFELAEFPTKLVPAS